MKKVIEVDLCCKTCASRAEKKLLLHEGVTAARANVRRNLLFVETTLPDETLAAVLLEAGFTAKAIRPRRGIFG